MISRKKKYMKYSKYDSTLNLIPQHHGDKETQMYMYDASIRFWCNTNNQRQNCSDIVFQQGNF